jgi:hypothetical protein
LPVLLRLVRLLKQPAQRADQAPEQESRYRDELQLGNHG